MLQCGQNSFPWSFNMRSKPQYTTCGRSFFPDLSKKILTSLKLYHSTCIVISLYHIHKTLLSLYIYTVCIHIYIYIHIIISLLVTITPPCSLRISQDPGMSASWWHHRRSRWTSGRCPGFASSFSGALVTKHDQTTSQSVARNMAL